MTPRAVTIDELTADDWKAFSLAHELASQIALHGHGRRTLRRFAQAILEADSQQPVVGLPSVGEPEGEA